MTAPSSASAQPGLPLTQLLLCAGVVVTLSMGIRHGFGLWLQPITQDMGWSRESFSLAIAVQNLVWGIVGVFVGMAADRWGAFRVLLAGSALYAAGLVGMALAVNVPLFVAAAGLVIGTAQAGTTYAVVYGILGRQIPSARRSWAMGVTAAAGSFGQFLMVPVEGALIAALGWAQALWALAAVALLIAVAALGLRESRTHALATTPTTPVVRLSIAQALAQALRTPRFVLLMAGYFVCGFQVVFIGVHFPSYLRDAQMPAQLASHSLALIGLFNIFGTYMAGSLAQKWQPRYLLAGIYAGRSLVTVIFLLLPISAWSVYGFSALMGLIWLATVPLTNSIVVRMFGVQHLSMLSGVVFCAHQIGSFNGVWLGGKIYDAMGNYDAVWVISIILGIVAALLNLPIHDKAVENQNSRP